MKPCKVRATCNRNLKVQGSNFLSDSCFLKIVYVCRHMSCLLICWFNKKFNFSKKRHFANFIKHKPLMSQEYYFQNQDKNYSVLYICVGFDQQKIFKLRSTFPAFLQKKNHVSIIRYVNCI